MRQNANIAVVMPALNEERAIGQVLDAIPRWVDEVVVVDNGSSDRTAAIAREHGAHVVPEAQRGYGRACLTGIAALSRPDIVVFLDADFSDHPDEMDRLVDPIVRDEADMVIGSRVRGSREPGALTPQARFGNWLSCLLMRLFWHVRYTDLGPFRAIRYATLQRLHMQDEDFGWTVEMQVKAAAFSARSSEVPVSYRRRIGTSKISGTARGVILAGTKILYTIFRAALQSPRGRAPVFRERLFVITRYPEPGKTKTRLIPAIGAERAARLQHAMTAHLLAEAEVLANTRGINVEVRFEGGDEASMRGAFGAAYRYQPQGSGDLGERLLRCVRDGLGSGAEAVVIAGADVPGIDATVLCKAFDSLRGHDLVLGPANDGGYTLIGLRRDIPEFFENMPWGTDSVLSDTLDAAASLKLSVAVLSPLDDVDRPEDLPPLRADPRFADILADQQLISVIIPTFNEVAVLGRTLERVGQADGIEIIIADGGSVDATREIAARNGARVLEADGGRAAQQNLAAASAKGDILLFLHADTLLPEGYAARVRHALDNPGTAAGAFRFRTDAPGWAMRIIEWGTNLRSSAFQLPYGDQGLFMLKRVFDEAGGFARLPIMEDFELVRRLRRRGRVVTLPEPAVTSARRWLRLGALRTTVRNQVIIAGFLMGVQPARLCRFYRKKTEDASA